MAPKLDPWIRNFNVSEPTKHRKGYTIYKVTSRVFPRSSPEAVTEVVVWKRYSDFKKLHKQMLTLHAKLYLSGTFPHFAKARLFGRFDETVIEERRQSALLLLEFIAHHSPLFTSQIFVKFFEDGQKMESPQHDTSNPLLGIPSDGTKAQNLLSPQVSLSTISEEQIIKKCQDVDAGLRLGGVWQYRQDQETISFSSESSEGETQATDSDSILSMPLTGSDLSAFDPLVTVSAAGSEKIDRCSNSWLLSALVACNHVEGDDVSQSGTSGAASFPKAFADYDEPDSNFGQPLQLKADSPVDLIADNCTTRLNTLNCDGLEHSYSRNCSVTKNSTDSELTPTSDSVYRNVPNVGNVETPELTLDNLQAAKEVTPAPWSPISPLAPVVPSVIDHTGNYLFDAANYISLAQQNEANGHYEASFTYYKAGVGRLLRGVQGEDEDASRRDAVRRKTAQYLIRAEEIYKKYLANEVEDENRWGANSRLSPTIDRDPTTGLLQASIKSLGNYKVLGIIDRVMLVLDTETESTFVMKVLRKSPTSVNTSRSAASIVPSKIPHMVQLYKFIETDYGIFLVLQHATGGKLWNYVRSYLQTSPVSPSRDSETGDYMNIHVDQTPTALGNVYSGKKLLSEDDSGFESKLFDNVAESPQELSSPENLSDPMDLDLYAAPECSTSYVELFTNYAASLQPDKTVGLAKCSIKHQIPSVSRDDQVEVLENGTDNVMFKKFCVQSTPLVDDISGTFTPRTSDYFNYAKVYSNDNIVSQKQLKETSSQSSFSTCDSNVISERACDSSPPCGLSHIRNMQDLEKLDAQELISCAQRLLKNVDQTLRQSKTNDLDKNIALPSSGTLTKSPTPLAKFPASKTIEGELGAWKSSSGQWDATSCEERHKKVAVPLRQRRKSSSSSGSGSGVVQDRRRSQRGILRQLSDDSAFASPLHENRLSSSVGSLVGTSRPRLRHLSVVFQQLDAASGPHSCLPESCVRVWAAEMVIAIARLHAMGIVCRDLRPDNILLGDRGHILLTYVSQWGCVDKLLSVEALDFLYAAPEVNGILPPTPACDWWSLGALLFELLTSKTLISCHPGGIGSHTQLNIPSHVTTEAQSFLQELLRYHANERLGSSSDGVEAIKSHPFFATINWDQMQS